ncbi:regulator of chromosome condensation 1/beta-lactamase-inhibitor protein II [Gymnopilus junonius]|uniref:Regulator of chromosome condensation 1/beta-lactamase-inhibitor protein II n=1 Tax=Gymnopilus junonius TaxID=109634 RepID=A0A9P5NR84_GYMJU|nr:regulator of chromosome condensation 1/beta-lactamase-inhibitor protein II [Gymnopilus junonius]
MLKLPTPIRSISCGRVHSSCLDSANKIWTFTNWGRPFRLSSPILSDPEYAPKQIECGWTFSSLLTKSGHVFIWWPFAGSMGEVIEQKMQEMDSEGDKRVYAAQGDIIPCVPWDLDITPTRLPPIPTLPDLPNTGDTEKSNAAQLVQIAGFDNHIVGLTNHGHVLKYGSLHDETGVPHGRWEYLPHFSEVDRLREQPAFSDESDAAKLKLPQTMKITHISANFLHFVAYSTGPSSIVLVGDTVANSESQPKIIRELQNKSVISVVIGDYHNAALTANGKLLTWGAYSNGALGLGDPFKLGPGTPGGFASSEDRTAAGRHLRNPPSVAIPTEVRFDHNLNKPRDRFCFATTAAGWHTGALVIDLEPGEGKDEAEQIEGLQKGSSRPGPSHRQLEMPPIVPLPGIFRVGHAGRGNFGGVRRIQHPDSDTS